MYCILKSELNKREVIRLLIVIGHDSPVPFFSNFCPRGHPQTPLGGQAWTFCWPPSPPSCPSSCWMTPYILPIKGQGKIKMLFQGAAKSSNKSHASKVSAIFFNFSNDPTSQSWLCRRLFGPAKNILDLIQIFLGPIKGQGKSKMLFQGAAKNRDKSHASKVSTIFKII